MVLAIFQQWLMPTALNSLQPFREMDYSKMLERLLLLAVSYPTHARTDIHVTCHMGGSTCNYVYVHVTVT